MSPRHTYRPLLAVLAGALPCLLGAAASAQELRVDAARAHPPRIYNTQRLVGPPPHIDGKLDDAAWKEGEWAGNYTQQNPVEGGKPSEETELKILYDDKYIYMAIRAHDDMSKVSRYTARRDAIGGFGSGDVVGVCFDSYFDKRAGFEFDLTAAGTKTDLVLSNEGWDISWDAVWDGKVAYEKDAWTAEFRVPLSQLRYGPQDEQVWGMHAWRWIDRLQEEDQWNLIPRTGSGRLYNFGELHGMHGLKNRRRIELLPHVVGQVESLPAEAGNPYVGSTKGKEAVGVDAKIGLTSNFTLDATVNPDFGQVEADPSVVNLTAFETFYDEKRPFFLEGKRLFELGLPGSAVAGDYSGSLQGDQMFYSRRIGAPPSQPEVPDGAFIQMPSATSILSAAKVTGKTKDGLAVGLLQSVTDNEYADVSFNGTETRMPVAPTTNYLVGRVQKDWDKGNSILGAMVTSTHRWLPGTGALRQLPSDASTAALDATRFFGNRSYVVEGRFFFSRIAGDTAAILALQTDPVHYYQRPDADYLGVDAGATSLTGHGGTLRVARYGNSKWTWAESARWMSPGLELNDLGYLQQADVVLNEAGLAFSETEPHGGFRSYGFNLTRSDNWDFGGVKTDGRTALQASGAFRNLWGIHADATLGDESIDTRLLRGGPAMRTTGWLATGLGVSSNPSRDVSGSLSVEHIIGFDGNATTNTLNSELDLRPANAFTLSANASLQQHQEDLQYVATTYALGASRYLLGRLEQKTLGLTFRANYVITPDLTIQYYGSPFVSNGSYGQFKRVTSPRAQAYEDRFHRLTPGEIAYVPQTNVYQVSEGSATYSFANPDFDFRQFRSNLVARWELRPGTSLYLVWSQDRTEQQVTGKSLPSSLDALRQAPATNVFLVKLSYWFGL